MKKILRIASIFFISTAMLIATSCSEKEPLDGTWLFDDGTSMTFDTKNETYEANDDNLSATGTFFIIKGGSIVFTSEKNPNSQQECGVSLTEDGFEIDFDGTRLECHGEKVKKGVAGKIVDDIRELNGTYTTSSSDFRFTFERGESKVTVETTRDAEKSIEKYSYESTRGDMIMFTSGQFAIGYPLPLDYMGPNKIRIDNEVLTKK